MTVSSRLTYHLQWDPPTDGTSAADVTWGTLAVALDGTPLWGRVVDGSLTGIRWTWVELLEWMALSWPWLRFEQGWPAAFRAIKPSDLSGCVQQRLDDEPEPLAEKVGNEFFEYRSRHDLSSALHGAVLPSLWIAREGVSAWVSCAGRDARLPLTDVVGKLQSLGDEIAARVAAHSPDRRAREVLQDWRDREALESSEVVAIATGLDSSLLEGLSRGAVETFFELEDPHSGCESEILAAARMIGPGFGRQVLSQVLRRMKKIAAQPTPLLDSLSRQATDRLSSARARAPYQEGHVLAEWLRETLGLRPLDKADPEELLKTWNVKLEELNAFPPEIDAVACWGPHHGPAVLVNQSGAHTARGSRSTLAHEIAHLLVDRSDALPVAEVLGGRTPPTTEKRARAFAAEFLAPREVVGEAFMREASPESVLRRLANHYGISHEIVAWQARNSGLDFGLETHRFLKQRVSRPELF